MYGFVFEAIKVGIQQNYSSSVWHAISETIDAPLEFEKFSNYDEKLLSDLAKAFAKRFRFTEENAMEYFGGWYIAYLFSAWKMQSVARTAYGFFKTWNDYLQYKLIDFPDMLQIQFKVFPEKKVGYRMIAVLSTDKYAKFLLGFVTYICTKADFVGKDAAEELAAEDSGALGVGGEIVSSSKKCKVVLQEVESKTIGGDLKYFHNINVQMDNQKLKELDISCIKEDNQRELEKMCWTRIFPFFVYFDHTGKVLKAGKSILKTCPDLMDKNIKETMKFLRPIDGSFELDYLSLMSDSMIITSYTSTTGLDENNILFICQFLTFEEGNTAVMIAKPKEEMYHNGQVFLGDAPAHDSTKSQVLAANMKARKMAVAYEEEIENNKRFLELLQQKDEESSRKDDFLFETMPRSIINTIRSGATPFYKTIRQHENVAVIFSDLCGFTKISGSLEPLQVVELLTCLWQKFDGLTNNLGNVTKIETIGDAYVVAAGVPDSDQYSAVAAAVMAVAMNLSVHTVQLEFLKTPLQCRIGVDIGSVVAGIVGHTNPRYSIYGETVIYAQKLEAACKPKHILISKSMKVALCGNREFRIREAKNAGVEHQVYWLNGFYDMIIDKIDGPESAQRQLDVLMSRLEVGIYKKYYTKKGSQKTSWRNSSSDQRRSRERGSQVEERPDNRESGVSAARSSRKSAGSGSGSGERRSRQRSSVKTGSRAGSLTSEREEEEEMEVEENLVDQENGEDEDLEEQEKDDAFEEGVIATMIPVKKRLLARLSSSELVKGLINKFTSKSTSQSVSSNTTTGSGSEDANN